MDQQKIIAAPAAVREIIRKARGRPAFYVGGATPLLTGPDTYLDLAPYVKVTRGAMLAYLDKIIETAERRHTARGDNITIELRVLGGDSYFV